MKVLVRDGGAELQGVDADGVFSVVRVEVEDRAEWDRVVGEMRAALEGLAQGQEHRQERRQRAGTRGQI